MKLLVLGPDPNYVGGVESILTFLLNDLKRDNEIMLHSCPFNERGLLPAITFVKGAFRKIDEFKPDVAITVGPYYHMLTHFPLILNGIPIVHWNHGIGSTSKSRIGRLIANFMHYLTYRSMVNTCCEHIVFVSWASKDIVEQRLGFNFKNARIIYNCAPLPPLPSSRREYEKIVLFNGRLIPEKGTNELVNLELPDDWMLEIFGSGRDEDRIKGTCKDRRNIEFRGFVRKEELVERLKKASVLVLPTKSEFFSISILEAMSQSMWVISTDLPSIVEQLGDAGSTLMSKDFNMEWKRHILPRLNLDQAKAMGLKAYRRYVDKFGQDRFIAEWRSLLSESCST